MTPDKTVTLQDYNSPVMPTWCPGCGNFTIWTALKQALVDLGIGPKEVNLCFDIGCNGNGADKFNAYAIKGLHGRTIPTAAGVHLANHKLPIVGMAGDGATFDEGINHLIHAIRSNYDFTFILHNNCDFGLTTGQATPTTPIGQKMNSSPYGVVESRLNPIQMVLTLGATFVARGFTGNLNQLKEILKAAITHDGFAYVEVLQHCPTYNKFQDQTWLAQRVYDIKSDANYKNERRYVYDLVDYSNEKIATGILYQDPASVSFYNRQLHRKSITTTLKDEVKVYDISSLTKALA
jgi:2-oxoglutarate ferredoxin oxidoreductase subunit beta